MRIRNTSAFQKTSQAACLLGCVALFLAATPMLKAGLLINEIHRSGVVGMDDFVEFVVTSDMTLAELDSIWFGDSNPSTNTVEIENKFNATEIISNVDAFTSTSDVILAGTIITVGGAGMATDFNYSPNSADPSDHESWNLTFSGGVGFDGSYPLSPFWLSQNGDAVWLSTSKPSDGSGFDDIFSAVGYDSKPGDFGDFIIDMEETDPGAYQFLTSDSFDGSLGRGNSLQNQGGASIAFAGGETGGGTPGDPGANFVFVSNLRAVPEPSTVVPCLCVLALALVVRFRKKKVTAKESVQ